MRVRGRRAYSGIAALLIGMATLSGEAQAQSPAQTAVPAKASAAPQSQDYVDYFEPGQAVLSPHGYQMARAIVGELASNPRAFPSEGYRVVRITGYVDADEARTGQTRAAPTYLDRARARALYYELLMLGVDSADLQMETGGVFVGNGSGRRVAATLIPAPKTRWTTLWHTPPFYFESGSAELNAETAELLMRRELTGFRLDQVCANIEGYTDTLGSVADNMRLSQRRADVVARALARLGLPWNRMTITGYGESRLARATADEVSEPLNRRATFRISTRSTPC